MVQESAEKSNSRRLSLAEWMQQESIADLENSVALIWPPGLEDAVELYQNGADAVHVSGPEDPVTAAMVPNHDGVKYIESESHELREEHEGRYDIEIGWAVGSDLERTVNTGKTVEEAVDKILKTSDNILKDNGTAIHNLNNTDKNSLDIDNQAEAAELFEEALEPDRNVRVYQDHELPNQNTYVAWKNEC